MQLEKGNKATAWSPSEADRQKEANEYADEKDTELASSLTITANKISLASQTIELTGNVLADAIEIGGDLKVGSRDSAAALEVSKSGAFYAKGSDGSNSELLEIDSTNRSIKIVSPYSLSYEANTFSKSTIDISASVGGVRTSNADGAALMSANGLFANKAGQSMFAASSGGASKASIVGLGNGSYGYREDHAYLYVNEFIAGIYGRANNAIKTGDTDVAGNSLVGVPAYGGYFDMLRTQVLV
ncbi:MAG: hypothetical protein ACK5JS_06980 [Mangrovibacterium sp.]